MYTTYTACFDACVRFADWPWNINCKQ